MAAVTVWRPPPRTLADVRDPDGDPSYPRRVLEGCETGLVLFAAAFWGRQDAWHMADAGLRVTCVDLDAEKLDEMEAVYPPKWVFVPLDVLQFAGIAGSHKQKWDVVSLDPFTNLMDECADRIDLWCSLANRAVILGTATGTRVDAPEGWQVTDMRHRSDFSGGVYWTVLEPA